ncbi:SDR family NAD(P)-dependent oxidoreductase [Flavisolibacter tropicus]|uniref:Epimerase n=1 Tax=Flavisolibacter tropicus TaxID=1492898 RepID=A0A172U1T6_9BACT|nr:SDR family NAD(P)-dependent oxidoreductase [Flavisolibacter tropicus]ANE52967.1 epimerase [Flavisolibacter tropicus]
MKIIVTGCAGFIGSHLCERLVKEHHKVVGIDNFDNFYQRSIKEENLRQLQSNSLFQFYEADIRNKEDLSAISDNFDVVIHLAAKAGVRPSIDNPQGYIDTNINGTLNILHFMLEKNINKIVFASSSSVYGDKAISPYREDSITDFPISPYAFTKKSCELLLHNYHNLYQIDSAALRFFTVYGPRQRPDLAIHKFFNAIEKQQPISIYGDGSTSRDYTYIDDTVDGIVRAMEYVLNNQSVCEVFNLGNNAPTPLLTLVNAIERVCEKKALLKYISMQQGDVLHTCADISKAQAILGYEPKIKLQEGLRRFYSWKVNELGFEKAYLAFPQFH